MTRHERVYGPVPLARTFLARWRGMRKPVPGGALLIETRSVHTFGMTEPIWVSPVGSDLRVSSVRVLGPGRTVFFPEARFVLEVRAPSRPPATGDRVVIADE